MPPLAHRLAPPSRDILLLRAINYGFARMFHDVRVLTPPPLPRVGSAIVCCNHVSGLDPLLIQSTTRRIIRWLTAIEYCKAPGLKSILARLRAIPVERAGRDGAAIRTALRALRDGEILGIFPEGKIEVGDALDEFQTGAAALAIHGKCPIVPGYLDGTTRGRSMGDAFGKPNRCVIAFGQPIHPIPGDSPEALTARLRDAIGHLRTTVLRRTTAGPP